MEKIIVDKGHFIVVTGFPGNRDSVLWITDKFPLNEFKRCLRKGYFKARPATEEEKEFCYWTYENMNKEGANLDAMEIWREYKQNKKELQCQE